jgi:hypothetical protein
VTEAALDETGEVSAVGEYKRIFKQVLDNRPSGMRMRLAHAMGKNRSFVSQISNSTYPVPVPIQHLNTISRRARRLPSSRLMLAPIPVEWADWLKIRASGASRYICRILEVPSETDRSTR